jgi:type I restriction enzyme S subunit
VSVPGYQSYRDSGIDWLRQIPSHWGVEKFRRRFRESSEKIDAEVVGPMLSVSGYRGIEVKEYDDENRRRLDHELAGYRIVRPGQLVVNTMWLNYAGLGVSAHEGHVSPAYRSYWIRPGLDGRYAHHLMRSGVYVQGYTRLLTGIRPNSLQMSRDDLMEFPVIVPPIPEQLAIAAFLDRETAKIDALVEAQRRLIELLKEKRQAVISRAVTKGLDPTAQMKDSGVEWLGEVPAHWEVGPLKRFADVLSGYAFPSTGFSSDPTHHRLLRGINIAVGEMRWDEVVRWPDDEGLEAFRVFAGDIVLGMDRPWIADGLRVARLTEQDAPSLLLQRVTCIRPSTELASQHLLRLFVNEAFYHHCAPEMTGVSVPHISPSQVLDYVVAVPPPAEQAEIDRRVSLETSAISDLVETAQQASALLHERRSALISAAVTGKIDVRGLSDHETEAA